MFNYINDSENAHQFVQKYQNNLKDDIFVLCEEKEFDTAFLAAMSPISVKIQNILLLKPTNFHLLHNLRSLSLSNCNLTDCSFLDHPTFYSLIELDLSINKISQLQFLLPMVSLQKLSLYQNQIDSVQLIYLSFLQLEEVNLLQNQLKKEFVLAALENSKETLRKIQFEEKLDLNQYFINPFNATSEGFQLQLYVEQQLQAQMQILLNYKEEISTRIESCYENSKTLETAVRTRANEYMSIK